MKVTTIILWNKNVPKHEKVAHIGLVLPSYSGTITISLNQFCRLRAEIQCVYLTYMCLNYIVLHIVTCIVTLLDPPANQDLQMPKPNNSIGKKLIHVPWQFEELLCWTGYINERKCSFQSKGRLILRQFCESFLRAALHQLTRPEQV